MPDVKEKHIVTVELSGKELSWPFRGFAHVSDAYRKSCLRYTGGRPHAGRLVPKCILLDDRGRTVAYVEPNGVIYTGSGTRQRGVALYVPQHMRG